MSSRAVPATGETLTGGWAVRRASRDDEREIVAAVSALLAELGGTPPDVDAMRTTARSLIEDAQAGVILVAESESGALVGVLAASWQTAIHTGGRYGLIQDLWVEPAWRGRAVGAGLLDAIGCAARELGIRRVEVGLPRASFGGIEGTSAFYESNGFEALGARMRWVLA